jgi:predicted ATPase/DNA-binding SARP family transcriptional activator
MQPLALTLFGSFEAATPTHSLRLPTDKTRALLAYLALTPDTPLRREMLAGLLWPEQAEALARQNLRKTAGRLKQAIHEHAPELAGRLLALTKQTIMLHSGECAVDVGAFRGHIDTARRHAHASLSQCAACLAGLEAAAALYRQGELLAGLSLPDAAPFEEWLLMQRENLRLQQLTALHQLTGAYEQQGDFERARQYAQWQIQHEPWREEAHRQLMRLLAAQGHRAEAIAQYHACRRILEAELGVAPSAETEALLTQVMDGALPVAAARTANVQPQPWPRLPGPLIGREADVARVVSLLAEPGCRLLTLTGPGGIGKTSLAVAVGEQLRLAASPLAPDGTYFVPLAEVSDPSLLPAAVAGAIGITLNRQQSLADQVERFIRPKAMMLILDNFEQLAAEAAWLRKLVSTAGQFKLLVTSREPLNWQGEWRYTLEGLAYPKSEVDTHQSGAVRFFVQAARQVQPDFSLTPENTAAVVRICQLVHGWPLALQMAAAWVSMMSCQAIADRISASLDLLTSSLRDASPRQRSIRIIFEHTWAALSDDEQSILGRLAAFRGGFELEAAMTVAAAEPLAIRGLIDKALLRHDDQTGRYNMHELLRQFAIEKAQAQPDTWTGAQQNHSRYYLGLLNTQGHRLNTPEFQAALDDIKADFDNVRQAWLWAAAGSNPDLLAESLGHMAKYYESSGLPQEAVALFRLTLSLLEAAHHPAPALLRAQLAYQMAESLLRMGRYADAAASVAAAQQEAKAAGDVALTNQLFITQAHIYREQGLYDQSHAVLREAIAFSRAHSYLAGVARALHSQGNTYWSVSAYEQARQCYEAGRQIYQQLGQTTLMLSLTGNIGVVQWRLGEYQAALESYEAALRAQRQAGNASAVAIWTGNIGLLYIDLHADDLALSYLDEALRMHDQLGRRFFNIELLLGKVAVLLRRGQIALAGQLHKQATELANQIGNRTFLLDCDLWQARLFAAQGCRDDAVQLLQALRLREFRPDSAATIARELERLAASLEPSPRRLTTA